MSREGWKQMEAVTHSQEEIAAAPTNRQVGTTLLFSNDRVNVWEILLAPGERVPHSL
jgi:hypothetical protein